MTDFDGHVLKKLGDGLMALFGYPQAQENDAERSARCARDPNVTSDLTNSGMPPRARRAVRTHRH